MRKWFNLIYYSYKSIYGWMTPKVYLFLVVLIPFTQIALFTYLNFFINGLNGMRYSALGNALYSMCFFVVFSMGASITYERTFGTLMIVLIAPINNIVLFLSKSVFHILEGLATVAFSLWLGKLLFKLDFSSVHWNSFILIIILTTVMMVGVGILAGAVGLFFRRSTPLLNVFYFLLLLLCGANFPVEKLHPTLQVLSHGIPLTYGIKILRALYEGKGILLQDLILLCLAGIFLFLAGIAMFQIGERYSRLKGTLDFY